MRLEMSCTGAEGTSFDYPSMSVILQQCAVSATLLTAEKYFLGAEYPLGFCSFSRESQAMNSTALIEFVVEMLVADWPQIPGVSA
jgi:hypothetical protein